MQVNKLGNQGKKGISIKKRLLDLARIPEDPNGCWEWLGGKRGNGYGAISIMTNGKKRSYPAHRITYQIFCGPIPSGMLVCHNCPGKDNRACINPKHLWLGTYSQNIRDAIKKGTFNYTSRTRGSRHQDAKLTEQQVIEIRAKHAIGQFNRHQLAKEYGVKPCSISNIIARRKWRHI